MPEPQRGLIEDDLAKQLLSAINDGDLIKDGRLPSERAMAERFSVTRARLRRALDLLQDDGAIFRRHGQGTFAAPPPATNVDSLRNLARQVTPRDVMEVRLEVEPALAALAAERADARDIKRLNQLVQATLNVDKMHDYEAADDLFHYKIAEAARNPLFLTVYESIRSLRKEASWTHQRRENYSRETLAVLGQQHLTLANAITNKDSIAAAEAMELHLVTVSKALLRERVRKIALD